MGNAPSLLFGDGWWTDARNNCDSMTTATTDASAMRDRASPGPSEDKRTSRELSGEHKERLSEFKLELARKHEKRRAILAEKRKEMEELREEVVRLKAENQELKRENQELKKENQELKKSGRNTVREEVASREGLELLIKENEDLRSILEEKSQLLRASDDIIERNRELRVSVAEMQRDLQNLNRQVVEFDKERRDYQTHVVALKDVIAVSKHMLQIRESQLREVNESVLGVVSFGGSQNGE